LVGNCSSNPIAFGLIFFFILKYLVHEVLYFDYFHKTKGLL
jgi:hypothetical protein